MSPEVRPRRRGAALAPAAPAEEPANRDGPAPVPRPKEKLPYLLDFFPLETEKDTRLSRFYDRLKEGRVSTTRCPKDGQLHWPPRAFCPRCHSAELEWVDLPTEGHVYAFSAVLAGAPLGMDHEVPFAVGLVDLAGVPLRVFGRIDRKPWSELRVGERVRFEPYELPDGRWFYRFRTVH